MREIVFGAVVWDYVVDIVRHDNYVHRNGYASAVADMSRQNREETAEFYDMPESLDPDKREDIEGETRARLRAAWTNYVSTPGHPTAVEHGCECPVLDNAHGKGVKRYGGELCFTINGGCPLHGRRDWS